MAINFGQFTKSGEKQGEIFLPYLYTMSADNHFTFLSKSSFINGMQCARRLWLQYHAPEKGAPDAGTGESRYRKGREIGAMAREYLPGGKDASTEPFDPILSIENTRVLIASGATLIYEASFGYQGLFASVDILVRKGPRWHAYEVKSGTSVKEHYLSDAAFQYHVLQGAGLPLSKFYILLVDNRYIRHGAVDPALLFRREPVLKQVRRMQGTVVQAADRLRGMLSADAMPETDIGPHCSSPRPCTFTGFCWNHIPYPSIFNIAHLGGDQKFRLYYSGVYRQEELPEGFVLTASQEMQVRATVSGESYVDPGRLRSWLDGLRYPLCLVDFECFQPAVPLYDDTRPYQQLPFQFSVHRRESPGGPAAHVEFLAEAGPDPRPAFIRALLDATGTEGSVLAYNKAFEVGRLKELARDFPEYHDPIQALIKRVADLMEPFEKKWYYAPAMQGSHSIKNVLPALVPGLHYDDLAISNGQAASEAFEDLFYTDDPLMERTIRENLLAYCKLDTEAMVHLLRTLEEAAAPAIS